MDMTPPKAIRTLCLFCMNGQEPEVAKCPTQACPLYGYRGSKKGAPPVDRPLSSLRAIRAYCLVRCRESAHEVRDCDDPDCALYRYRFGKNPDRKPMDDKRRAKLAETLRAARDKDSAK